MPTDGARARRAGAHAQPGHRDGHRLARALPRSDRGVLPAAVRRPAHDRLGLGRARGHLRRSRATSGGAPTSVTGTWDGTTFDRRPRRSPARSTTRRCPEPTADADRRDDYSDAGARGDRRGAVASCPGCLGAYGGEGTDGHVLADVHLRRRYAPGRGRTPTYGDERRDRQLAPWSTSDRPRLALSPARCWSLARGVRRRRPATPLAERRRATERGRRPTAVPAAPGAGQHAATPVTVLDDGRRRRALPGRRCWTRYPPQCGGPPLVGWDWADHQGDFDAPRGVRWGDFVVTGTFDGTSVTPSEVCPPTSSTNPTATARLDDVRHSLRRSRTAVGSVLDPALTTDESMQTTMTRAGSSTATPRPGSTSRSIPRGTTARIRAADEALLNDPAHARSSTCGSPRPPRPPRRLCATVWGGSPVRPRRSAHRRGAASDPGRGRRAHRAGSRRRRGATTPVDDSRSSTTTGRYQAWADATYGRTGAGRRPRCRRRRTRSSLARLVGFGSRVRLIELMQKRSPVGVP